MAALGRIAGEPNSFVGGLLDARNRGEQGGGVGMTRVLKQPARFTLLHDLAEIHHRHPTAQLLDNGEIVGDEDDAQAPPVANAPQQVEDLCLHRHIQ